MAKQIDGFRRGMATIDKRITDAKLEKAAIMMELGKALGSWEGDVSMHPVSAQMVNLYMKGECAMTARQLERVSEVFLNHKVKRPFDLVKVAGLIGLRK